MNFTIYHNPRCSKSRLAFQLLHSLDHEVRVIEYLKNPPDSSELTRILNLLRCSARDFIRKGEVVYKELALDSPELSDESLILAMVENPILIERPVVLADGKAVVGRPPERVHEFLNALGIKI